MGGGHCSRQVCPVPEGGAPGGPHEGGWGGQGGQGELGTASRQSRTPLSPCPHAGDPHAGCSGVPLSPFPSLPPGRLALPVPAWSQGNARFTLRLLGRDSRWIANLSGRVCPGSCLPWECWHSSPAMQSSQEPAQCRCLPGEGGAGLAAGFGIRWELRTGNGRNTPPLQPLPGALQELVAHKVCPS